MHGKSFFKTLIEDNDRFRDHVTVAWGPNVTVVTDNWWFNCKVNGKGIFLHDLDIKDPFSKNIADSSPDTVKELYEIVVKDAGGKIPDYLIKMADDIKDSPFCSELAI